jgi:membrane protein DedA with SNARE-associated domain
MDDFAAFFARYGLAAIFLFTFLENVGLPIPAFPVLMLAGAYASAQHTAVPLVVGVAVAGALLADGIWYYVGRWRGKPVLDHLCRVSFNPDACLERSVDGFHRRKSATILFAKFLPGVNTIIPPLAGVAAMPFLFFLLLDFAGALLWAGAAVALGFAFGEKVAETARGFQGMLGWLLLAGLAVTVVWRIAYRFWLVKWYSARRLEPEEVHRRIREGEEILILDLRRDDDYAAADRMVAGAVRVRPASFHRHAHHLPRDRELVFYCT